MTKNATELNFDHSKFKRIQIVPKKFWACAMIKANMVHTKDGDTNLTVTAEFDLFKFKRCLHK